MENNNPRTIRDFVEDLLSEGRTPIMIRAVAESCRWAGHLQEINDAIKEISIKFKKYIFINPKFYDNIVMDN